VLKQPKAYNNFPLKTVFISNTPSVLSYLIGTYLMFSLGTILGLTYLLYILYIEFSMVKNSCSCCWYYGKLCAFARGKIAPLFFKKQDSKKFCQREVTFAKMLPQMLVLVFPLIAGIILLIKNFNLITLSLILIPPILWFGGNPIIFGKLVCKHCQQGRICCPANDFFGKKVKK
jgi:hypothetical protein